MRRLDRLLVPFDTRSNWNIRYGIQIAHAFHAHVHFIHVRPTYARIFPFRPPDGSGRTPSGALAEEEQGRIRDRMRRHLRKFPLTGISHTLTVLHGMPAREILNAIGETEPDLVVLGTEGMMTFEDILMGLSSLKIIENSPVPVLSIRPDLTPASGSSRPLDAEPPALGLYAIRRILAPTDFSPASREAVIYAGAIARYLHAELHLLFSTAGRRDVEAPPGLGAHENLQRLAQELTALYGELPLVPQVSSLDSVKAILDATRRIGMDLIVMSVHGEKGTRFPVGSTARRIIQRARCPVLTLHPGMKSSRLENRYHRVFKTLEIADLTQSRDGASLPFGPGALSPGETRSELFLKHYSPEGLLSVLEAYGIFPLLRKKGFDALQVRLQMTDPYRQRVRVIFDGKEDEDHLIAEIVMRETALSATGTGGMPPHRPFSALITEWLYLQNPRAAFSPDRPPLPGQRFPGLRIGHEILELLIFAGRRLAKDAVTIRAAHFHSAKMYHQQFSCLDPRREGQLIALIRDTENDHLADVSWAIHLGCLRDDRTGAVVSWDPDLQVFALTQDLQNHFLTDAYHESVWREVSACRFSIDWDCFQDRYSRHSREGTISGLR